MDPEISNLHQQISNLLNESVRANNGEMGSGDVRRLSNAERRMLVQARLASGPMAGGEWRKASL